MHNHGDEKSNGSVSWRLDLEVRLCVYNNAPHNVITRFAFIEIF